MPIVGEAYVLVRAITSGVKKDIENAFDGVGSAAAADAGKSLAEKFSKAFNDNQSSGGNFFSSMEAGLNKMVPDAQKVREEMSHLVQVAHTAGTGIAGMIGTVSALAGGLVGLAGTAASASISVAALGNVWAALASGMGVVKLAFKGVGTALSDMLNPGSASAADTQAAFDNLTKTQQAFVKFVVSIKPQLTALQEAAANSLLGPLTQALQLLSNKAYPTVLAGITAIGTAMGKAALTIAQAVTSGGNMAKLTSLIGVWVVVIKAAGVVIGDLFGSFLDIMKATAPVTEDFVAFIVAHANDLKKFLDVKLSNGSLVEFFQTSEGEMSKFGKLFSNIFKGLGAIVGANFGPGSGGDMLLSWLIKATSGFANLGKTAKGQANLADYFRDVAKNTESVLGALGSLLGVLIKMGANKGIGKAFDTLKTAAPALGDMLKKSESAAPELAKVVVQLVKIGDAFANSKATKDFFDTIETALKAVSGLLTGEGTHSIIAWGAQWTARLSAIGLMLKVFKFGVKGAVGVLSDGFGAIGKAVDVGSGISHMTSQLKNMASTGNSVKDVFEYMKSDSSKFGQVIGTVGSSVVGLVSKFKDFRAGLVLVDVGEDGAAASSTALGTALDIALGPIGLIVVGIAALVAGLIWFFTQTKLGKEIWKDFVSFLKTSWTDIQKVFTAGLAWVTAAWKKTWNAVSTVFKTIWKAIVLVVTVYIDLIKLEIQTAINIVKTIWTVGWDVIKTVFTTVWKAIKAVFTPIINAIKQVIQIDVKVIELAWRLAWMAIKSTFTTVWNAIKKVATPVINFIKTAITVAVNAIKKVWTTDWNLIKTAFTIVWNAIKSVLSPIINWIKSAITSNVQTTQKVWSTAWNTIKSVFTDVWDGIESFFSPIITWIRKVITSEIDTTQAAWSVVWNAIKSVFTTVWNGIISFFSGIVSKVSGLVSGFISVWNSIIGFIPKIESVFKSTFGGIWSFIQGIISDIVGGVRGMVSGIISGINTMVSGINAIGGIVGIHVSPLTTPKLAAGGTVYPSTGGSIVNVAEAGQPERIEPLDPNGLSQRDIAMIKQLSGPNQPTIQLNLVAQTTANANDIANTVSSKLAFALRKGSAS